MAARQNLRKRMKRVGERSGYNALRASWGPEWEALALRRGHPPFRDLDPTSFGYKLANNSVYGKMTGSWR